MQRLHLYLQQCRKEQECFVLPDELFVSDLDDCRLQRIISKWVFLSLFFSMPLAVVPMDRAKKKKHLYTLGSTASASPSTVHL